MATDAVAQAPRTPPKFLQPILNVVMTTILRSPFHSLVSDGILLLSFPGLKSGKHYSFPLGYAREENEITIFTPAFRRWWRNLLGGVPVSVYLKGRKVQATAEAINDDKAAIADGLCAFVIKNPRAGSFFNVKIGPDGKPDHESAQRSAQGVTMIRIHL